MDYDLGYFDLETRSRHILSPMSPGGIRFEVVGAPGFEPGTSRTPSVRATRLRYAPTGATPTPSGSQPTNTTVSLGFEQRQETAESIPQVQEHLSIQLRRLGFSRAHGCALNRTRRGFRGAAILQIP